ncbi:hypothetical protein [Shewanella livingstonensis]|uniref:Uncharacterized protein n=1 Tax=Shewanella livingstonensis TaxID=150120 RepID=A0A3G8LVJ3_9GAMM|nr:hypothetical protein [Shewanella livingstonensis]AZG73527.1 hypothetical protein EGC82_12605 [Shewanella livingstonensis]
MREIRAFYSIVNYSFNAKGRRTGKASLIHSLRLSSPSMSGLTYLGKMSKLFRTRDELAVEWDVALSAANLIDTDEGIVPLDSFSQEQREQILFDVMGDTTKSAGSYAEKSKIKSKALYKIKQWLENENVSGTFSLLMKSYIESNEFININEVKDTLNQLDIPRKKQKIAQITKYIKAHNALIDKPKTLNSTNFEEVLFKIPVNHCVGTDIISNTEMMSTMKLFLQTFYSEYPIKLMVLHHDERLPNENTGGHVHAFISGKNSLTGEYDLRLSQIKRVNEFLIKRGDTSDCLDETGRLRYIDASSVTSYMQQMFYEFINADLFNKKDLNVEFSPASERNSELRKQMNAEARLPKYQRQFNYYNRTIEWQQQQVTVLKETWNSITYNISTSVEEQDKLKAKNIEYIEENRKLKIDNDSIKSEIFQGQQLARDLTVDIQHKKSEKVKLNQTLDGMKKQVNELGNIISQKRALIDSLAEMTLQKLLPLSQILERMFKRLHVYNNSDARGFLGLIVDAFNDKLSPQHRDISIDIAKLTKDSELESALKRKNQKLTKDEFDLD